MPAVHFSSLSLPLPPLPFLSSALEDRDELVDGSQLRETRHILCRPCWALALAPGGQTASEGPARVAEAEA
eukprot:765180-Hanusia_phi.AAC.7